MVSQENHPEKKLLVKLKLPKMAKEEEEEKTLLTITKKIYTCDVCEKSFNNGKALGGHISSAHVQSAKYKYNVPLTSLKSNITKKKASSFSFSSSSSTPAICPFCEKEFPSAKSLTGHMRCHPERAQGRTKPPQNGTEIGEMVMDLSKFTFKASWTVKGIRGREGINPRAAVDSEENIEFLHDNAVHQLVKLMNDNPTELENAADVEDMKSNVEAKSRTSASKELQNAMDLSDEVIQTNQGHEHTNEQVQNHEEELYANTKKSGSSIGTELAFNQVRYSSQQIISADENTGQTIAGKVLLDLDLNKVPNWGDEDVIWIKNAGRNQY